MLRSLQIMVGPNPRIEVHLLSSCSHRPDLHPLPFCHFPLRGLYSPNIQVVTRIPSAFSHRSVPRPLHPHSHRNICPLCSHGHWSKLCPPWDGYTPFLGHSTSHVDGRKTLFLWITLMFQRVDFVLGGAKMDLKFPPFPSWLLCRLRTSIPRGSFLRLGLFCQLRVEVSLGSSPKGFTFGLSLVL